MSLTPVIHTTIDQIASEFKADAVISEARYKGYRLIFKNVEVEEVHTYYYQSGGAIAVPMVDYFRSGSVRFELLDYRGTQQRVQPGFVLNLDGVCFGMQGNLVRVGDCLAESVIGDLGTNLGPVIGY